MMIGEHYFALGEWGKAKESYGHITDEAATSDLAIFKIAWCEWKLGNPIQAAKDFKRVLDKADKARREGTAAQRRRSGTLKEEALEYLVIVFTEDRSISPKEVFDFLVSIDGEKYSRDVMIKVAESYAAQAEWDRSGEAYRFLIKLDPDSLKAAEHQRSIITELDERARSRSRAGGDQGPPRAATAPGRSGRRQQKNREAPRALARADRGPHADHRRRASTARRSAARSPRRSRTSTSTRARPPRTSSTSQRSAAPRRRRPRRSRSATTAPTSSTSSSARPRRPATSTSPSARARRSASCTSTRCATRWTRSRRRARRTPRAGSKLYDVDKKFGEAIDLYATLFPADASLVGVIFKNGQMFFDYGEYDEAIKRFGVIVTKYPKDPNAGPAGDRILAALNKAKDYENIESWARKLKTAPSFAAKDQQERLAKLIVESIQKSGDKYAEAGRYEQAATFYLRVPKETSDSKVGAQAWMNAGVMYEKAKLPEHAADVYLDLAEKYADKNADLAEKAAFSAGQVYEKVIYYDRAAKAYEMVWTKFRTGGKAADALFNAGLLRQALGQNKEAIAHYREYTNKFPGRKDAPDVAFNIGVVYENVGEDGPAYKAYAEYARVYRSSGKRIVEAWTRAGRMSLKLGQYRRAKEELVTAQRLWKSLAGKERTAATPWAAEARYHEGELVFREYEKVTLDVKPAQLEKALKAKSKLLGDAEKVYGSVIDYQDLKWATAALFRMGQVYDGFAEALATAGNKPPPSVPPDLVAAYQDKINEYVVNIQDKAVELFATGYKKAIDLQVYDEYTAKIREALGRLAAQKYPPERESRSRERIGDRPPVPELVTELVR